MQLFCRKLNEATQMLGTVDYVRVVTLKKTCKYEEYGLFEYLLFFCCVGVDFNSDVIFLVPLPFENVYYCNYF